ncbi:MAG TPA: deaminase [Candidatus Bathyarchaeia archaeon]|nr:deaminase [Candidatus Bathyarchaeia archaeon]
MEKYLRLAINEAEKSGCRRAKRGAVIIKNGQIVSRAHNLVFPKNSFCEKRGCLRDKLRLGLGQNLERCRSIHAEALAICRAASKGISLSKTEIFMTGQPCINCAKLIYASGVKKVYYLDVYGDRTGAIFLNKMGVLCQRTGIENDQPKRRIRDITSQ